MISARRSTMRVRFARNGGEPWGSNTRCVEGARHSKYRKEHQEKGADGVQTHVQRFASKEKITLPIPGAPEENHSTAAAQPAILHWQCTRARLVAYARRRLSPPLLPTRSTATAGQCSRVDLPFGFRSTRPRRQRSQELFVQAPPLEQVASGHDESVLCLIEPEFQDELAGKVRRRIAGD